MVTDMTDGLNKAPTPEVLAAEAPAPDTLTPGALAAEAPVADESDAAEDDTPQR